MKLCLERLCISESSDILHKKEIRWEEIRLSPLCKGDMLILLIIVGVILLVIMFVISLNWTFYNVIFYPSRYHIWSPKYEHKTLMLESNISAWHFSSFADKPTVLFCHGNAGNISHRQYIIDLCQRHKLNLLLFDYQGFGRSSGHSTPESICQDGLIAYDYLQEYVKNKKEKDIYVWGESLGGAVATYIASNRPCSALILMCTFASLGDIPGYTGTNWIYQFLSIYMNLMGSNLKTKGRISTVECPIVILHSKDDEIIPFENSLELYKNVSHTCKLFIEIRGGHTTPKITPEQLEKLFKFCSMPCCGCVPIDDILDYIEEMQKKDALHQKIPDNSITHHGKIQCVKDNKGCRSKI